MVVMHFISFILSILTLITCFYIMKISEYKKLLTLPIMFISFHIMVFYSLLILKDLDIYTFVGFTQWSPILRIQTISTFLILNLYRINSIKQKRKTVDGVMEENK
jgi:hypothetical protein